MGSDKEPSKKDVFVPDLPVLRYIEGGDTSSSNEELLKTFKEAEGTPQIEAESDSAFAVEAQRKTLDSMGEKFDTELPATRVLVGAGPDQQDDEVWNAFQNTSFSEEVDRLDKKSVEQFARDRILTNVGNFESDQQDPEISSEPKKVEDTKLPKARQLIEDPYTPDEQLLQEFKDTEGYDPDSELPAVTQLEQEAEKKLYGKVNLEIDQKKQAKPDTTSFDLEKDPEEKEESWTSWFLGGMLSSTPSRDPSNLPDEELSEEEAEGEKIVGSDQGPISALSEAVGNEDVRTGEGALDVAARLADTPMDFIEFAETSVLGSVGGVLDTMEDIGDFRRKYNMGVGALVEPEGEPPKESFYETDLPDVPGIRSTGAAEKMINDDGEIKSSEQIIMEADEAEDVKEQEVLLTAAAKQRRKERYDNMSALEAYGERWPKMAGRAATTSFLGAARQFAGLEQSVRDRVTGQDEVFELKNTFAAQGAKAAEDFIHDTLLPVEQNVDAGAADKLANAIGSLGGFMASTYTAIGLGGVLGKTKNFLREGGDIRRHIRASAGRETGAETLDDLSGEDLQRTLGDEPLTASRLDEVDNITDAGLSQTTRDYFARNSKDVEEALSIGGNTKFRAPQEMTKGERQLRNISRIVPGVTGGGAIGWNSYRKAKMNPDPSVYPDDIANLIRQDQRGEDLTPREQEKLNNAVERRAIDAYWASAPAGWSEAVTGRFIDTWFENAVGTQTATYIDALKGFGQEFTQESFQGVITGGVEKGLLDPEMEPFSRIFEDGFYGGIAGMLAGAGSSALGKVQSQRSQLEDLGVEEVEVLEEAPLSRKEDNVTRVPKEALGVTRARGYQKQRAKEINESEDGEPSLGAASFARSAADVTSHGGARLTFELEKTSSDQVRPFVKEASIRRGEKESYASQEQLRRQDRVAKAVEAIVENQTDLTDEEKISLTDNFYFHDVESRPLTASEISEIEVAEDGDNFTGATYSDVFDTGRFRESHVFADASETDAFEELFHAVYDHGGEEAKQRAVGAYNDSVSDEEQVESYEEGREKISRKFAESINKQASFDSGNAIGKVKNFFSNIAQKFEAKDAVDEEVANFLSGQAQFDWGQRREIEDEVVVIQKPNITKIQTPDGNGVEIAEGILSMDEPSRQAVRRKVQQLTPEDSEPLYVLRPDQAESVVSGEGIGSLMEDMSEVHKEHQLQMQTVVEEIEQEISGVEMAEDAAEEAATSKGIPDLPDEVTRNEIKELGFNHPNHAVNAVNKDRRDQGKEEYGEDESVPVDQVEEAAQNRALEQERPPATFGIGDNIEADVTRIRDLDHLRHVEQQFRSTARDIDVKTGEQDAIRGITRRIRRFQKAAQQYSELAEQAEDGSKREARLALNSVRATRLANSIAMGLNERMAQDIESRNEVDFEHDIERSGTPRPFPRNARIPTWAEARYIPRLNQVFVWDPSKDDDTGLQEAFERLDDVETNIGAQPTEAGSETSANVEGGEPYVIQGMSGAVVRVQETDTTDQDVRVARINESDVDRLGLPLGAAIVADREGTWVRFSKLIPAQEFIEQKKEEERQASEENRPGGAARASELRRFAQRQLDEITQEESEDADAPDIDLSEIDRVDPENVEERTDLEQALFLLNRARDHYFNGDRQGAQTRLQDVVELIGDEVDLSTLTKSVTNNTPLKVSIANRFDALTNLLQEGVPEIETEDPTFNIENREELETRLFDLISGNENLSNEEAQEQAEATAALFDARAEAFSKRSSLPKSVWYRSRIAEITGQRQGLTEKALTQIRNWHGTPREPFERFRDDKVDTGEGVQAQGWGHYSTGKRMIAVSAYADRLSSFKGRASWSLLGGQYEIRRSENSVVLEIYGPDGERLSEVDQEEASTFGTQTSEAVEESLETAKRLVAQDAIRRGVLDQSVFENVISAANRVKNEKERVRDRLSELTRTPEFGRFVEELANIIQLHSENSTRPSEFSLEMDLEGDIERVVSALHARGIDAESVLSEGQVAEEIVEDGESNVTLSALSEWGVPNDLTRQIPQDLPNRVKNALRRQIAETGYAEAASRLLDAKEAYAQAKENFEESLNLVQEDVDRSVLEVTLHKGKDPSEYHYVRWRETPDLEEWSMINSAIDILQERGQIADEDAIPRIKKAIQNAQDIQEEDIVGTNVRLKNDPDVEGELTGRINFRGSEPFLGVDVGEVSNRTVPMSQLETEEGVDLQESIEKVSVELIDWFDSAQPTYKQVYFNLAAMAVDADVENTRALSKALLEAGIDGTVYAGNAGYGNYDNYVTYDASSITVESAEMFQLRGGDVTGAIDFLRDGRSIIHIAENADADTIIEEMGHLLLEDMPYSDREVVANALRQELGNDDISANNLREITEAHEQFADWFRRYVREGEAPTQGLRRIFEDLKRILSDIWQALGGTAFVQEQVPQDVRATIDRLFLPNDPRSRDEADQEGATQGNAVGLRIDESGQRVFYADRYKQWVYTEGNEPHHHRLTPDEFESFQERSAPDEAGRENVHKSEVFDALSDEGARDEVTNASIIEYLDGAPEGLLDQFGLTQEQIDNMEAEDEISQKPDGLPPDVTEDQNTEVTREGEVVREDLDEQKARLLGVLEGEFESLEGQLSKGKEMVGTNSLEFVTPVKVQNRLNIALAGRSAQQLQQLQQALESEEIMDSQELSEANEAEEDIDQELTEEQLERREATYDRLNEIMGDDNTYTSFEEAIADKADDVERNFRQAQEFLRQYDIARQQENYPLTSEDRTERMAELRERFPETASNNDVLEEAREMLEENDAIDAPSLVGQDKRARRRKARNEELRWQEQGEDYENPLDWFEEFWLAQSSRSRDDRPNLVSLVEEKADEFMSRGEAVAEFGVSSPSDAIHRTKQEGSYIWMSFKRKQDKAGDLNGGLFTVEEETGDLFDQGLTGEAVLVTPNFTVRVERRSDGSYQFQIREPTQEELEATEEQADSINHRGMSSGDAHALTSEGADFYHDSFTEDQGNYSVEEKIQKYAAKRPLYELSADAVLVERSSFGGRSNADRVSLSLIAPEAEGPVAVFYSESSGNIGFGTRSSELAEELSDKYEDEIINRIEEIEEQEEDSADLFEDGDVVSTESVDENTQEYVEGLRDMLGIDNRIAVVNPSDIDPENPGPFTGEHRAGRLIPHDELFEMEKAETWVGEFGNGDYYLVVREDLINDAYKSEAIAHEIGHIVFNERLSSQEHQEARRTLQSQHRQSIDLDRTVEDHVSEFMSYHRLKTSDYIDSVKDLTLRELMEVNPQLFNYITSFDEWVAEQTARFITTRDAAGATEATVQQFYNEVSQYFKNVYRFLMQNNFGPDVEFGKWVDHHLTQKETSERMQRAYVSLEARPYNNEVRAQKWIDRGRQEVPEDRLGSIRDAVRTNAEFEIEQLPPEQREPAGRYMAAFREVERAQDRTMPNSSPTVLAAYATSPPTESLVDRRMSDVMSSVRERLAKNNIPRSYFTTIGRHVRVLARYYPQLKPVIDAVYAPADAKVEGRTFEEAISIRRNEFFPEFMDAVRLISGLRGEDLDVPFDVQPDPDRLQRVVEILQDPNIDASSEQSIREVESRDDIVEGTVRLRNLFDDFFDYLVEADALPEDAKLEDYFPVELDIDEVMAAPDKFERMIEDQLRRTAAKNKGRNPDSWTWENNSNKRRAQKLAKEIRDNITSPRGEDANPWQLYKNDEMDEFRRLINVPPDSIKHRYLLFLNHNNSDVQQFYNDDPMTRLASYFAGNIRYAEYTRRFGAENEKIEGVFQTLEDAGAAFAANRLRGLLKSIKRDFVGRFGKVFIQYPKLRSVSRGIDKLKQSTTAMLLQFVSLSTGPEFVTTPLRTGPASSTKEAFRAIIDQALDGTSEFKVRMLQRFGVDSERRRNSMRRMLNESAALADRTVDTVVRSRMSRSEDLGGAVMKAFFNVNLLRGITRTQRVWTSMAGRRQIIDALENAEESGSLKNELERLGLPTDREGRLDMLDAIDKMDKGKDAAFESEEGQKFLTALQRIAKQSVVESTPAKRPLWMNDKNPIWRIHGQFRGFTTAFREGPVAYISDETIQRESGESVKDYMASRVRLTPMILAMMGAASLGDKIRWDLFYNLGDPEQREIYKSMRGNINPVQAVREMHRGHWEHAWENMDGLPRTLERSGLLGTSTFGVYHPLTSIVKYDADVFASFIGPGASVLAEDALPAAGSAATVFNPFGEPNLEPLGEFAAGIAPGGQSMQVREWYKRKFNEVTFDEIEPIQPPDSTDENGTNTP